MYDTLNTDLDHKPSMRSLLKRPSTQIMNTEFIKCKFDGSNREDELVKIGNILGSQCD